MNRLVQDAPNQAISVWVLSDIPAASLNGSSKDWRGCWERLGDARRLADSIGSDLGVCLFPSRVAIWADHQQRCQEETPDYVQALIERGADAIFYPQFLPSWPEESLDSTRLSNFFRATVAGNFLAKYPVQVVFAGGEAADRELASQLAALMSWTLISPAIWVQDRQSNWLVTQADPTGQKSCQREYRRECTLVVSMKDGIAEPLVADASRVGSTIPFAIDLISLNSSTAPLVSDDSISQPARQTLSRALIDCQTIPVDPAEADIRNVNKLVAGGRGLGSRDGFQLLQHVAQQLTAGVAASRMAVDLGWIDYDRQVGQTGKSVDPDLYIACGISGASHHLDGITAAKHVIAINTDEDAPIMKRAQLGLVADLQLVLEEFLLQTHHRAQVAKVSVQNSLPSDGMEGRW